jgi:hypothetical protein
LGDCGRTANFAQLQDFDLEFTALVSDAEHVANADIAGRLGFDLIGTDATKVAGFGGESARPEETRSPEPFVDAYARFVLSSRQEISRNRSGSGAWSFPDVQKLGIARGRNLNASLVSGTIQS